MYSFMKEKITVLQKVRADVMIIIIILIEN